MLVEIIGVSNILVNNILVKLKAKCSHLLLSVLVILLFSLYFSKYMCSCVLVQNVHKYTFLCICLCTYTHKQCSLLVYVIQGGQL